jgi:predicted MPP superfamily phosphohydrolase
VIISAGVGMSGVPMRLMVPPEVVEISLTREA